MKNKLLIELPNIFLILAMLIFGVIVYPYLPDQIPSHWNFNGEIDQYTDKAYGVFTLPLITLGIYILFLLLPSLDPRRENYEKFSTVYHKLKLTMVLFFAVFYSAILLFSLGYFTDMPRIIMFIMGALFILIGNYFGKLRQNYFIGLKFPWTLADEEVWNKTHRLGGKLWVASGIIGLLSAFIGEPFNGLVFFGVLGASTFATVIYSYVIYDKKKKIIS